MSDSLLIQEITDLRARLSEAEAENKHLRICLKNWEQQGASLGQERLMAEIRAERDEEKRKREEAEKAVAVIRLVTSKGINISVPSIIASGPCVSVRSVTASRFRLTMNWKR